MYKRLISETADQTASRLQKEAREVVVAVQKQSEITIQNKKRGGA